MSEQPTIIPPVEAGNVESTVSINYQHDRNGAGGFEARTEHTWTFDHEPYHALTGLSLGGDCPVVHQANGHVLRVITDYKWTHSSLNGDSYILGIEAKGVKGTHRYTHYWTMSGFYDLERTDDDQLDGLVVTNVGTERQAYRQRQADREIPHEQPQDIRGEVVQSGEQLVYKLHHGLLGSSPQAKLQRLIEMDSPDEAIPVSEYTETTEHTENENVVTATTSDD
jgi:hypothetical protein